MLIKLDIASTKRQELRLITEKIQQTIQSTGIQEGICTLFCPHTTSALTINSYLDPATGEDLLVEIDRLVPTRTDFIHIFDTPSDAAGHIKSSLIGNQLSLIIQDGKAMLGGSQGIFFWEFDGPRSRNILVKFVQG